MKVTKWLVKFPESCVHSQEKSKLPISTLLLLFFSDFIMFNTCHMQHHSAWEGKRMIVSLDIYLFFKIDRKQIQHTEIRTFYINTFGAAA